MTLPILSVYCKIIIFIASAYTDLIILPKIPNEIFMSFRHFFSPPPHPLGPNLWLVLVLWLTDGLPSRNDHHEAFKLQHLPDQLFAPNVVENDQNRSHRKFLQISFDPIYGLVLVQRKSHVRNRLAADFAQKFVQRRQKMTRIITRVLPNLSIKISIN